MSPRNGVGRRRILAAVSLVVASMLWPSIGMEGRLVEYSNCIDSVMNVKKRYLERMADQTNKSTQLRLSM